MSEKNVELVLKELEYWNRGDFDAFVGLWDDDVVLRPAEGWPERVYYGKDAVRSFYKDFAETVGRDSVIEDLIDAGDDVVVMRMRAHMTGAQSGLEGDMRFSQVTTFREGKVVLAQFFWDHQEALEAAGLER
jgi:ketosteroid isomerase-like protein